MAAEEGAVRTEAQLVGETDELQLFAVQGAGLLGDLAGGREGRLL